MATGLEFIGGLSGVLTIVGSFIDLSGRFRRCIKALSHAQEDIRELEDEITTFTAMLEMFHEMMRTMAKKDNSLVRKAAKVQLVKKICRRSETILRMTKNLLVKVEPLRTDKNRSLILRTLAKWKWLMDKNDVQPLFRALNSAKLNLILFIKLLELNEINEEIARLKAANKEISSNLKQQVARYRKQVGQLERQCEEAERRCKQLQYGSTLRRGHVDQPDENFHLLVKDLVRRELEQERDQRALRGSEPCSSPPSPPASSSAGNAISGAIAPEMIRSDPPNIGPVEARASHISIDNNIMPPTQLDGDHIVIDTNQTDGTPSLESARPRTDKWVPMAGWGEPKPQERPKAPRESQEDLPPRPVIYDDGTQVREEYRRPRRDRQGRRQAARENSSSGSALSGGSGRGSSDTGSKSSSHNLR